MLRVQNLSLRYGDLVALENVSLEVGAREIVAVVGANGAGKSSLIRSIAGMQRPCGGRILFDGEDVTGLASFRTCNLGIGHVAEGRQVFPSMSVRENLEVGATLPRSRHLLQESSEKAFEMFPRLRERSAQAAGTLSGGEQQMLAIARCLMGRPRLVMLDEPSLGLSPAMVGSMFECVRRLHEDGIAIVLVEQNVAASLRIASRAYVLENGRIALCGTAKSLLDDDRVRRAYLGVAT